MADKPEPMIDQTDTALVRRFKQGDETAFDILFGRYKDNVYSLVYRGIGPAHVDDAVQEVFIRMYRSLGRFRGDSSLRTWLYRISLNTCSDFIKRSAKLANESADRVSEDMASPLDIHADMNAAWTNEQVKDALSRLPAAERLIIELHYVQGLSYSEVAEVIQCPSGTVKARVHRTIARLKCELAHLVEEVA